MERKMKLNSDIQRFNGIWISVADPPHLMRIRILLVT
jgi:hypothetical protein